MNVAYLCADFGVPFFGTKGASIHMREMVSGLSEAGHSMRVVSPALDDGGTHGERHRSWARGAGGPEASGRVQLIPIALGDEHRALLEDLKRVESLIGVETRMRQEMRNLLYNLALYDGALGALREPRVDFVYERYTLFGLAGVRLAGALGVPHLLEINAPLADEQERMRGLEMKALAHETERRIFRSTSAAIVVSSRLAEHVGACGVPESRIHVLPNGVDPRRFAGASAARLPAALRDRWRGQRVIGFLGTLKPWHGTEVLLDAFARLLRRGVEAHLLIVGDGPGREALQAAAAAAGMSAAVSFAGSVLHDDVPDYLAAMDVATAPYTSDPGCYFSPIKVFEYMAAGLPVVAGRAGQIDELLEDGETAVLVEPGDVEALSHALERLIRDPALTRHIGERGRDWVERERTWGANASRVVEIARALAPAVSTARTGAMPA